jgi:Xaa-Pro aminopeptidase
MSIADLTPPDLPELDFAPEEYGRRVQAVRSELVARNAEALLVDQFEHLVYLFGYLPTAARYQACLLPVAGPPHMIVRALDLPTFRTQSWVNSYTAFTDMEDPIALVADLVKRTHVTRLALETDSHFLTVQRFEWLRNLLRDATFVDFSSVLWELRLIKSDPEIAYMREAARIADTALRAAADAAGEGKPQRAAAAAAYATAIELGADNGRLALFAAGKTSDTLHGRLGSAILSRGDILHMELAPQVRGYGARIMRPVAIGDATAAQERVARRLIAIQDEQIAAMRPGAIAAEVDQICRGQVLSEGLRSEYPSITAYTLGYHATPRTTDFTRVLMPGANWALEVGMTFHVYIWAKGMAFSETVLVGQDGPERLTTVERSLFIR